MTFVFIIVLISPEFYGIEVSLLKKAIYSLSKKGLAELIPGSDDDTGTGVKFFA